MLSEDTKYFAQAIFKAMIASPNELPRIRPQEAMLFRDNLTTEFLHGAPAKLMALEAIRHAVAFEDVFDKVKSAEDIFEIGVLKPS
jgi:hypothetical protein